MSKFCASCGTPQEESAKFCAGCGEPLGENATSVNTPSTPSGAVVSRAASSEKAVSAPKAAGIPRTVTEQKTAGPTSYIAGYIRQSLAVLKNPRQLLPTFVLGLVWLVLALLGSLGINPLPVRILSFLTFAQGGMFGGVLGAVGGIIGKVAVAAFLNAAIVPLFQKKAPFSGIGGGIKGFFGSLAVKSLAALSPLSGGVGLSLLLYAFMNSTQSLQNSMVGIIGFFMLLQNIGRQGGFLWGLAFSVAGSISKGRTPAYLSVSRCISGMTLGFALGVALSVIGLRWCGWLGIILLVATLVFAIVSKKQKGVATA